MLDLDIIKGQWRVFDRAVAFGFKKTHFYTGFPIIALKGTHNNSTCGERYMRNISVDHASGTSL